MNQVALCGQDTIILTSGGQSNIFTGFGDGDVVKIDYPNDMTVLKVGKNGNAIYAFNYTGLIVNVDMRILAGCADDALLQQWLNLWIQNPPAFPLITGQFIKNIGDGNGNIQQVQYELNGGAFKKGVMTTENADGNTDQAIAPYSLIFSNSPRKIT